MTLLEICQCVDVPLPAGAPELSTPITSASSMEDAGAGDVVFFEHPKYLRALRATKAGVALVPLDFNEEVGPVLVRVARPSVAFDRLLERLRPGGAAVVKPGIHPTAAVAEDAEVDPSASVGAQAVIESGVRIGARTVIGAQVFVGRDSQVGADCLLHPQVMVAERSVLGDRVIVQSGAVIGSDGFGFHSGDGTHRKIPQIGFVQIDDDVEVGACTTIDRARFGRTWIQTGTKIDNLVQIAHNVVIGPHCLIVAQTGISGSTRLGRHVVLAGQVGVVGHVNVGDGVVVRAKGGITKDTPAGQHLMGSFGVPLKEARELVAHYRRLPKTVEKLKALEAEVVALRKLVEGGAAGVNESV
jgi:UDP-3-O-[3-hydroxymyristoyl] glucosamine N-acyltransferase